jgi:DNA-binding beta-propeller fold protein YncE
MMTRYSQFFVLLLTASLLAQTSVPEIPYDSIPNLLKLPEHIHLGEAVGVATNSKGHIFVYTRTGSTNATLGGSRVFTHGGARLFEFSPTGSFIREIGQGAYGLMFAHTVRVDPHDNVWIVDEGSNMIIKFNPEGRVVMTMGRKPESVAVPAAEERRGRATSGAGVAGDIFNRPTDVAWDAAENIFVSDGYGNSRVAKFDKNGKFIKSWGSRGMAPGQFNTPHSIATDAEGNVYVGDRGNKRLQVFDNDGTFKTEFLNVGAPWAICVSQGPHQYLFSSNSNGTGNMENGEIYMMELDGRIVGKFGTAGKLIKEFGSVHEMDCRNASELYVGEITNWRIQKLTLHPNQSK